MNSGLLVAALMCCRLLLSSKMTWEKNFVDEKNTVRDLKWTMP